MGWKWVIKSFRPCPLKMFQGKSASAEQHFVIILLFSLIL